MNISFCSVSISTFVIVNCNYDELTYVNKISCEFDFVVGLILYLESIQFRS